MSHLRDEAEALAEALELSVCDIGEVIAWADVQILREDPAPVALCEVSISHDCYPQDVAAMLRQVPGEPAKSNVHWLLVTLLDERLKLALNSPNEIASALYQMAIAEEIEDASLKRIAWSACESLELADESYIEESREKVVERMAAILNRAAQENPVAWTPVGWSVLQAGSDHGLSPRMTARLDLG